MRVIKPSIEVTFHQPVDSHTGAPIAIEEFIELAGRVCYKSEDRITPGSAEKFVAMIEKRGHYSVLEHAVASAHLVCDRGVTHELVRHRLASYSQESTRYCNYTKTKHEESIGVIMPPFTKTGDDETEEVWRMAMENAQWAYFKLIAAGEPPQIARSVLPISLKTEIVMTANLREWMHVFTLRCSSKAHPQIRALMRIALDKFADRIPSIFGGLREKILKESDG